MNSSIKTWALILSALSAGTLTATATSGCRPPVASGTPSDNITTEEAEASLATPAPGETETAAAEAAESPRQAAAEEAPAQQLTAAPKAAAEPVDVASSSEPRSRAAGEAPSPETILAAGGDWPQWGGTRLRNNTPTATGIPTEWSTGEFDRRTGEWDSSTAKNIKWVSQLGSQTYGNPVIANGKVFVGTNNSAGHLPRYPGNIDLGCLLAFSEEDGTFLWQHSSEKLPTGRVHDWPLQGICSTSYVEGDRLWFVTSRGEVRCLDTEGFYDDEDDGPETGGDARLVDVLSSGEEFEELIKALDNGQLTDSLTEKLSEAGMPVDGDAKIATVTAGKAWDMTVKSEGIDRELVARVIGPRLTVFKKITPADKQEADVVWVYDMMQPPEGSVQKQGISQHNMCSCSVTAYGDLLFVNTSNGVDESHINIPAPDAPSFMCMNKNTGEVYWTDKSPGLNILHGQWSSPTVAELGGVVQVLFAGGDGWIYSFTADRGEDGQPELLWKFDCNPKESEWILGGAGTRNNIIATPVVYDGLVYVAVGQDPEHGEGEGHLWCIDPTKRGDVSPQLAVKVEGGERQPIPHKRIQAVIPEQGEAAVDNPNSAVVWHYSKSDWNGDGQIDFEEEMHRSCGTVAIKDNLLFISDFSGIFHCLDAKGTPDGQPIVHWTYDMLAQAWGSPLIVDGHVYVGDEDGDVAVFNLSADPDTAMKDLDGERVPINADEDGYPINMGTSVYSTPVVANGVLYISTKDKLFAIAKEE